MPQNDSALDRAKRRRHRGDTVLNIVLFSVIVLMALATVVAFIFGEYGLRSM